MKMKHALAITILFLIQALFLRSVIAQDYYTQLNLPEGAKARLSKGKIEGICFSPDGMQIAVGSATGVWLYDARTGAERALFTDHISSVGPVVFSLDGKTLMSGMFGNILLWDITTGKLLKSIKRQGSRIKALRILEDGKTLLSENSDGSAQLWDITTGKKRQDFAPDASRGLGGLLRAVVGDNVSTARLYLNKTNHNGIYAVGYHNGKIRLEDATTGRHLKTLQGDEDYVRQLVFSPDGTLLASGISNSPVRLWDVNTGHSIMNMTEKLGFSRILMFSKDSKTLIGQTKSGEIELWDVETKKLRARLGGKVNSIIHKLAFSPDAKTIAGVNQMGNFRIWDANTGAELLSFTATGHTERLNALAFSQDGSTLASGSATTIQLWDALTFTESSQPMVTYTWLRALTFSPDGRRVIGAKPFKFKIKKHDALIKESVLGTLSVWDARTGNKLSDFGVESHKGKAPILPGQRRVSSFSSGMGGAVVFSQNGYMLATVLNSKRATADSRFSILVWEVPDGKSHFTLKGHTAKVNALAFTPNGHRLASGSNDKTIRLWDTSTGTEILNIPSGKIRALAFSMDGKVLASVSSAFSIELWDVATGSQLTSIKGQNGYGYGLAFSADNKILASGAAGSFNIDGTIRLWDIATGNELSTLKGHTRWIKRLTFSGDGKTLASGSEDGVIFLWDVPR